jgi:hypothetical protein
MNAPDLPTRPKGSALDFDMAHWKNHIQDFALDHNILDYLQVDMDAYNADTDPALTTLTEPTMPEITVRDGQTQGVSAIAQVLLLQYQNQLQEYNKRRTAVNLLLHGVKRTLPREIATTVTTLATPAAAYHKACSYTTTNAIRIIHNLKTKWNTLLNQSANYNPLQWLTDLEVLYTRMKDVREGAVSEASQQLLEHIGQQKPWLVSSYRQSLGNDPDFIQLVEKYRDEIIFNQPKQTSSQYTQIATHMTQPTPATNTGPTVTQTAGANHARTAASRQGRRDSPLTCICLNHHSWVDCYYLNPEKRANNWIPKQETLALIADALATAPKRKRDIERAIRHAIPQDILPAKTPAPRSVQYQAQNTTMIPQSVASSSSVSYQPQEEITFLHPQQSHIVHISSHSVQPSQPCPPEWIVDGGTPIHITPNRNAFAEYHPLDTPFQIAHGEGALSNVIGIGSVPLIITRPDGSTYSLMVSHVHYVPHYSANLISSFFFEKTYEYYHEPRKMAIVNPQGQPLIRVETKGTNYVFSCQIDQSRLPQHHLQDRTPARLQGLIPNNPPMSSHYVSSNPPGVQAVPAELWHARMGHPGRDIMDKLEKHTDAKIKGRCQIEQCESCRQAKAKQQISRVPMARGAYPLDKVHFDYIYLLPALNYSLYLLHFYDPFSSYHLVYDIQDKSARTIQSTVVNVVKWAQAQGSKIRHFHSDTDKAIESFDETLGQLGIRITRSTPHNHEQNPFAEKAGDVLLMLMRALHIHSGLPDKVWPWTAQAAAYILNRRPTARLNWETPESVLNPQDLAHRSLRPIRIIGCKAYVLRKQIPKLDKLSSRVWIGYLVGYKTNNIWHIWDPTVDKIRTVRDVTFDETSLYKDTLQDIPQLSTRSPTEVDQLIATAPAIPQLIPQTALTPIYPGLFSEPELTENGLVPYETPDLPPALPTPPDSTHATPEPVDKQRQFGSHHVTQNDIQNNSQNPLKAPQTYAEYKRHPDRPFYYVAMKSEVEMINARNSWILIPLKSVPDGQQILPLTWRYTAKPQPSGSTKHKARLCVLGNLEKDTMSSTELYAHTAAMASLRVFIAISAIYGYVIYQLDAVQAFLQALLDLERSYYIRQPPGLPQTPDHVYKLLRPLYGLRTSPRDWFNTCVSRLKALGGVPIPEETSLWRLHNCLILFYVDDFLIAGPIQQITHVKALLLGAFDMKDLGLASCYLSITITQTDAEITLDQNHYIRKLHQESDIQAPRKHPGTPIRIPWEVLRHANTEIATATQIKRTQRLVGSLYYIANNTRPDIAKAVHSLSTHTANPATAHVTAAEQILQYLDATQQYILRYKRQAPHKLSAATDSSYADLSGCRSSLGHIIFLYGTPIVWSCHHHPTVVKSTTEAELMALAAGTTDLIKYRRLLQQLDIPLITPIPILCDNKQTVQIVNNTGPFVQTKLKHIDIQQHWLRQLAQIQPDLQVVWVDTANQPADGLTKLLPLAKHTQFVRQIRLAPE